MEDQGWRWMYEREEEEVSRRGRRGGAEKIFFFYDRKAKRLPHHNSRPVPISGLVDRDLEIQDVLGVWVFFWAVTIRCCSLWARELKNTYVPSKYLFSND